MHIVKYIGSIVIFIFMVGAGSLITDRFAFELLSKVLFWPIWVVIVLTCITPQLLVLPRRSKVLANQIEYAYMLEIVTELSDNQFGTERERDSIHRITDELSELVINSGVGEYDGDEYGNGKCSLYFFSNSPNELLEFLKPIFNNYSQLNNFEHTITKIDSHKKRA